MNVNYILSKISRGGGAEPKHYSCRELDFVKALRFLEFFGKKDKLSILEKLEMKYYARLFHKLSKENNLSIPLYVFDSGLMISHLQNIIISSKTKVGKNCRLFHNVTIGIKLGHSTSNIYDPILYGGECPTIGDGVTICSGAGIFGGINIADGITVGANAVVTKSFNDKNLVIAGIPAKVISCNPDWSMNKFADRVRNM